MKLIIEPPILGDWWSTTSGIEPPYQHEYKRTKITKVMKNIKIEIPEGYEIDQEKSTFTEIVFKKNYL